MAEPKRIDEATGRYLPVLYPEEMPFWTAARNRQLKLQRCEACGHAWYPIGPSCPECASLDFAWAVMSGRGRIANYVVYHKPWVPFLKDKVPYAVVQVELEEGPRLTTNLLDHPVTGIRIGMEVEAAFEDITDAITLLQFRPAAVRG